MITVIDHQPTRRRDGALSRAKLRAVIEYVDEPLDANLA